MRLVLALLTTVVCTAPAWAQAPKEAAPPSRYGRDADLEIYPQSNPKEALASVLKAIGAGRVDYLLAQLVDPAWVDAQVKGNGGHFEDLVKETSAKLAANPASVKELEGFLYQGEWEENADAASARLKDKDRPGAYLDRQVFLRKLGNRWYFENRTK